MEHNDLAILKAEGAIRRLKYDYAAACDDNYNGPVIAQLFTEDAVADWRPRGVLCLGRADIVQMFAGVGERISWAKHFLLNPRIAVDASATTANGTWSLLSLITRDDGPSLMVAEYVDSYECVDGVWLHSSLKISYDVVAPWQDGWQ